MTLSHKVRFTTPFKHSHEHLYAWCFANVGARYITWDREIAHMDYEKGLYLWVYMFHTAESAAAFAITHA